MTTNTALCAALASTLLLTAACNQISRAPQGTPRVELEVVVMVAEPVRTRIPALDHAFTQALRETVLGKADVGLRFYPVLTDRYTEQMPKPDYRMTVTVRDLAFQLESRTTTQPGQDPVVESWINRLDVPVGIELVKRRPAGPELTVGTAQQSGTASVSRTPKEPTGPTFPLQRTDDQAPLPVAQADLLRAIESGLSKALKDLLPAMDRELNLPKQ